MPEYAIIKTKVDDGEVLYTVWEPDPKMDMHARLSLVDREWYGMVGTRFYSKWLSPDAKTDFQRELMLRVLDEHCPELAAAYVPEFGSVEVRARVQQGDPVVVYKTVQRAGGAIMTRRAVEEDLPVIMTLVAMVDGDLDEVRHRDFVVAETAGKGQIVGCGRIRGHPGFLEMASLVTLPRVRKLGVADSIVRRLLERHAGRQQTMHLICGVELEDWFARYGFAMGGPKVPDELLPKFDHWRKLEPVMLMTRPRR